MIHIDPITQPAEQPANHDTGIADAITGFTSTRTDACRIGIPPILFYMDILFI